ncbi:hypothetical protein ZOSMA_234G00290 [Zostera marina]|uniref:Uncharacterized protein n=1 Tax=Zostera marina TaxID=29655 RepID=A0A0K9PI79_ZOSMR|nr:hypothetical protein ZOSMA_234G00290 [Zostera marina]
MGILFTRYLGSALNFLVAYLRIVVISISG